MRIALLRWLMPGLLGVTMLSHAVAADIYRWVDEKGRTHVSDTVPARYVDKATRVDTSASTISAEDQRAAQERAARERQLFDEQLAASRKAEEAATASQNGPSAGGVMPQRQGPTESECVAKWNAYWASQECFAPFVKGAGRRHRPAHVSEEAYLYCKSVPDPSAECGILPDRRR